MTEIEFFSVIELNVNSFVFIKLRCVTERIVWSCFTQSSLSLESFFIFICFIPFCEHKGRNQYLLPDECSTALTAWLTKTNTGFQCQHTVLIGFTYFYLLSISLFVASEPGFPLSSERGSRQITSMMHLHEDECQPFTHLTYVEVKCVSIFWKWGSVI